MKDSRARSRPSALKGRLAEVYFPALVSAQFQALAARLGERAIVDDPLFGRSKGLIELERNLREIASWLSSRDATFERFGLVTGSDRDVTEGMLTLTLSGDRVCVPVALVAERRRERAVALRAYYATAGLKEKDTPRRELLPSDNEATVPPPVAAHIEALARGDVAGAVASFEIGGTVRDALGVTHAKVEPVSGPLSTYYERLLSRGGIQVHKNARADDGRTCALEYTVVAAHGSEVSGQPGLSVYERGESGLLRTVRVYDDFDLR